MSSKRGKPRDPMLVEVIAAIGAGRIELGPIHAADSHVYGYCDPEDDNKIRLNQAPHAVEIAIHEATHRMRPRWSERAVKARTTRLLRQLSDREIDTLYNVILSTAQVRKRAETL